MIGFVEREDCFLDLQFRSGNISNCSVSISHKSQRLEQFDAISYVEFSALCCEILQQLHLGRSASLT